MAYADVEDVLARAGRFAGVFDVAGKRPSVADLDTFVAEVAAVIDSKIRARGFNPGTLSDEVVSALRDVNAWAVLIRALPSALVGDPAADDLLAQAKAIVAGAGFEELAGGGGDVFTLLEVVESAQEGGGAGSSAGSFWDDVGEPEELRDTEEITDAAAPLWLRGQAL